ncbi:AcrR family transcriptional regulator [Amycolatopsis bartoniae]|uniref:TetR family transcriptional regulator n=1 Tax=Amycolatopsis bartoniae TaxID=941986 RepID=A0A8H9IUK7_9PSEU|nr:TetR/AcrR family transcriptional regulator [Amycolatopsis bartoniae]MBB2937782.1 AcrR family transcriptional regulator [Amycolatopsis bartoniae]TVT06548.1 TetR/AcrR family transcriptional regulator [Amycolatopsis bartoniae]GHF40668.1 TetR family transcriptional regulator [Amycolatopsis bartoniae]
MPSPQLTDPRSRRSRSALEGALLELIEERDLSQISISDVTRRAAVNRSTFYEHYTDVHDLAAAAGTELFDELIAAAHVLLPQQAADPAGALARVFGHVAAHARLYRALLDADGSARVINHLHQRIAIAIHVHLAGTDSPTHADDPAEIPHDPPAALLAGALLGTIMDWLRRGCPGSPEDLAARIWPHLVGAGSAGS